MPKFMDDGAALASIETLDESQRKLLLNYLFLLQKWNKVYNLSAVRSHEHMMTHHLLDCLSVVEALRRQGSWVSKSVLDVGSGAGLPGIVLAIAMPELHVTCLDAVGKKVAFIQQAIGLLGLKNVVAYQGRVEKSGKKRFDLITSRAFASLAEFVEQSRHHLSPNGIWLAMKGKRPDLEIKALPSDVCLFHVEQINLNELPEERCLIWMRPINFK